MTSSNHLITTQELSTALKAEGGNEIAILDCSWYLPAQQRNPQAEFEARHIPGARFFDIDVVCDKSSDFPHMLPTAKLFSATVGGLGIGNQNMVVVYDGAGLFSAPRVWWMFHVFNHHNVRVLNGGLPKWEVENRETEKTIQHRPSGEFIAKTSQDLIVSMASVLDNCSSKAALVLDARSTGRFDGTAPEPRPGLPSGHMPGAISLPFDQLQSNGVLKPAKDLRALFNTLGVTGKEPVITTCGSGVTAAIITLALAEAGFGLNQLYDGAWTEWGAAANAPIISA